MDTRAGIRPFLLFDISGDGSERVRYKPDGTGDLDLPEGTHTSGGWSVQCLPADCLTSLTIVKRVAGTDGTYPATFHYSGTITGEIAIVDAPFSYEGSLSTKIGPGPAMVTETPDPDWPLTSIECDAPATVDLVARSVVVEIADGTVVTCLFLSDLGTTVPSDRPDTTDAPGTSPPVTCSTHQSDWAAGQYGVDTLIFEVTVPWCHGEGIVRIDGPITVKQVVDPWFVPEWLSPIYFKADDGPVTHLVTRTGDTTLKVYAAGRFQACSSVIEVIGAVGAPAALIKTLVKAKRLPPLIRRTIIKRIVEHFDRTILRLIRGGAQLSIDDEFQR